jgi:hypothetical protein
MLCYSALTAPQVADGLVRANRLWDVHFYTSLHFANQSAAVVLEEDNPFGRRRTAIRSIAASWRATRGM